MTLAIAIVALLVAGYALWEVRKVLAALAEFADMVPDDEGEPESGELWLSDGEFYSADRDALSAALPGVLGFVTIEGVPSAVMPNGVWSLHKLLSEGGKPEKSTVRTIK